MQAKSLLPFPHLTALDISLRENRHTCKPYTTTKPALHKLIQSNAGEQPKTLQQQSKRLQRQVKQNTKTTSANTNTLKAYTNTKQAIYENKSSIFRTQTKRKQNVNTKAGILYSVFVYTVLLFRKNSTFQLYRRRFSLAGGEQSHLLPNGIRKTVLLFQVCVTKKEPAQRRQCRSFSERR